MTSDGHYVVSGCDDNTIKIWGVKDGKLLRTLQGHTDIVTSVAISPDGKYIVSGSGKRDGTIKVWKLINSNLINTIKGHSLLISSTAITPDGKYIVSGGWDNKIKIWELESGSLVKEFEEHEGNLNKEKEGFVNSVAISPDGKYIVSGSGDNTIKVWRLEDGSWVRTLNGHEGPILSVAISHGGKYIVSGSSDGTIRIWRMNDGKLLATCMVDRNGNWAIGSPNGYWDANEGGRNFVVVNKMGTLEIFTPGMTKCDRMRYKGLLSYIWNGSMEICLKDNQFFKRRCEL